MASDEHCKDDAPATATIAVHGVEDSQQPFGAVVSPVFHLSTYGFTGEQLRAASDRGRS
jgi:cystathionine beta-lyase/cystathionine gamma-synthase